MLKSEDRNAKSQDRNGNIKLQRSEYREEIKWISRAS